MKKIMLAAQFLLLGCALIAQSFEGKIVYKIGFPVKPDPQVEMMMPKEALMFVKNDKIRMEMSMGMGMNTTTLVDGNTGDATTLMNLMGSKYAIESKAAETAKDNEEMLKNTKVNITDSTKTIAGYKCKKAVIEFTEKESGKKSELIAWFTKELNISNKHMNGPFQKIDGTMLEYLIEQQGMKMVFTASEVTKQGVDESMFNVPEGYKKMTQEEMKKMFGGQ